jgi:hypothetical protein
LTPQFQKINIWEDLKQQKKLHEIRIFLPQNHAESSINLKVEEPEPNKHWFLIFTTV